MPKATGLLIFDGAKHPLRIKAEISYLETIGYVAAFQSSSDVI